MQQLALYAAAAVAALLLLAVVALLFASRRSLSFEEAVLQPRKQLQSREGRQKQENQGDNRKEGILKKKKSKKSAAEEEAGRHDHVEFKVSNEVVPLDEDHEELLAQRQVHVDEKPKKPILATRTREGGASDTLDAGSEVRAQVSRGNSFDVMHPKDDYELIKSHQSREEAGKEGKNRGKSEGKKKGKQKGETRESPCD